MIKYFKWFIIGGLFIIGMENVFADEHNTWSETINKKVDWMYKNPWKTTGIVIISIIVIILITPDHNVINNVPQIIPLESDLTEVIATNSEIKVLSLLKTDGLTKVLTEKELITFIRFLNKNNINDISISESMLETNKEVLEHIGNAIYENNK